MPLFSSKLALTTAASSSGTALANVEFIRGAFYSVEKVADLDTIPVERIANDQIVWVESSSATYQATFIPADFETTFVDSASWAPFSGFGGGSSTLAGLSDVSGSAADGQVLQYDSASGNWVPTNLSGAGGDITAVFTSDEGIIGGASSGNVVLELVGGNGITVNSSGISVNTGSTHFTSGVTGTVNFTPLNTFTGSIQAEVNNLQAATGSYVTLSQTSSMTVLSASYAKSASIEILTEISSSHAEQADSASYISPGLGLAFENDSINLNTGSTHFTNAVQALSDTSIFALTGSDFSTTNKLQITGSLSLQLDTSGDELAIYSGSEKKFSITNEGILRLTTQSASPTAIKGGMYLDSNYDLYIGQD